MSRRSGTPEEPRLFDDLPLRKEAPAPKKAPTATAPRKPASPETPAEVLPLFPETGSAVSEVAKEPSPEKSGTRVTRPRPGTASFRARLAAGVTDLAAVLAVGICSWIGLRLMEVDLQPLPGLPLLLFALAFSFLYCVFPLAFWGRTPGMAWLGLQARSLDDQSLSFGQTTLRWLAGVLTVACLGLPLLLVLGGTYLSDRLSGSKTLALEN